MCSEKEILYCVFDARTFNMFTQVSQFQYCLEDNTMSNPVHTSETRMCGDIVPIPILLPGGQYIANQVQPYRLIM